jgi:phosphate transport system permease protein
MNANERLYRKRALKNGVALCLSCGATAFGLLWLAWILVTTMQAAT